MSWKKLALALSMLTGACTIETTFTDSDGDGIADVSDLCAGTPSGVAVDSTGCPVAGRNEGTLATVWTVNGVAASVASCGQIATVRFIVNEGSPTGPLFQAWDYDCTAGGFDSRVDLSADAPTVPVGVDFYSFFEARDASGNVLESTEALILNVTGHADLFRPDFKVASFATISGSWTINSAAATPDTCAAAGVNTVRIFVTDTATSTSLVDLSFACGEGGFDGALDASIPAIEEGANVTWTYEALDAADNLIIDSAPATAVVTGPAQSLGTIDFPIVIVDELTINLTWETDLDSGVFRDCRGAEMDTFSFQLFEQGGASPISSETNVACDTNPPSSDIWIFSSEDIADFGPGNYEFVVNGTAADGTKWDALCSIAFTGGAQTANCEVIVVP